MFIRDFIQQNWIVLVVIGVVCAIISIVYFIGKSYKDGFYLDDDYNYDSSIEDSIIHKENHF